MYVIQGKAFAVSIVILPFKVRFRRAHILRRFFNLLILSLKLVFIISLKFLLIHIPSTSTGL